MSFDGTVLAAVKKELEDKLSGGRIDKIHQPEKEELILTIRQPGINLRLLLSAHAHDTRINLTAQSKVNPLSPPLFCMVLRKHLEGGRITRFSQPELERVLWIHVEALDELGNYGEKILVCEVMGKHSNIILADSNGYVIIDSIKRVPHHVSRHREVLPGRPYLPPPEQNKQNPLRVDEDKFKQLIMASPLEILLEKALLKNFTGLSPQTCREIVFRAGLPESALVNECGAYELQRLWETFSRIASLINAGSFNPTLVRDTRGKGLAFSAFDLTHRTGLSREYGTMSQVLDAFYRERSEEAQITRQKNGLLRLVNTETERNSKKFALQEEALLEGEEADRFRLWGELITANLYQLKKGWLEATLPNFYDPDLGMITIPLDPQLTPAENAQKYFKKYSKARDSKAIILEQKTQTLAELNYLETIAASIDTAEHLEELAEIQEELRLQGYLKEKKPAKPGQKKEKTTLKPKSFTSTDGLEILVGKNNRQNDFLTLKLAKVEDLWFHAKDIPGSHVVLRIPEKGQVPEKSLLEAASLAAYYSKAREGSKAPVDYTLIKNVHKPKGAKPGMVIYDNQRTLYVMPSPGILEGLPQNGEG